MHVLKAFLEAIGPRGLRRACGVGSSPEGAGAESSGVPRFQPILLKS
jgi:hypothetical protein